MMTGKIPGVEREVRYAQNDDECADDREGEVGPTPESAGGRSRRRVQGSARGGGAGDLGDRTGLVEGFRRLAVIAVVGGAADDVAVADAIPTAHHAVMMERQLPW